MLKDIPTPGSWIVHTRYKLLFPPDETKAIRFRFRRRWTSRTRRFTKMYSAEAATTQSPEPLKDKPVKPWLLALSA